MQSRREALQLTAALVFGSMSWTRANATGLLDILELGKTLGDAAEAVGKLGDSVAHLVALGSRGWDVKRARQIRQNLVNISAEMSHIYESQMGGLASLQDYRDQWGPPSLGAAFSHMSPSERAIARAQQWKQTLSVLNDVLHEVEDTLTRVNNDRSDFVLQSSYRDIQTALAGKETVLRRLIESAPPSTTAEFTALGGAIRNYDKLHTALKRCIDVFNTYVAGLPR